MKLNNRALQELYDTLMNLPLSMSPYEESPIEKAFRECDEKFSESITFEHIKNLENDIDIWKRSNEVLLSANADLANKKKKLEKEVEDLKKAKMCLEQSRQGWVNRANKSVKEFNLANKEITELKNRLDKANADRTERENEAIRELVDVRSQLNYCTHSRDNWRSRAKYAEEEIEALKKDNKDLEKRLMETTEQYQKLTIENKRLHNSVLSGYDQGQTDLWVKLQNVNDSQPFELATCFPDVTGMEDILSWDLEDFLDAYKKWWEEKEKERLDHMRDYLARFCEGRCCKGCPLESNEFKCGCGYSFRRRDRFDTKIIPDEELEKYYNKAWHGDADCMKETRKRIKEACDAFREGLKAGLASEVKEVPVSCDIPIKDLASWECTIEATVEINKDLLEKVCGVKPEFDISDKSIRNLTDSEKKAVQDFINSLNRKED